MRDYELGQSQELPPHSGGQEPPVDTIPLLDHPSPETLANQNGALTIPFAAAVDLGPNDGNDTSRDQGFVLSTLETPPEQESVSADEGKERPVNDLSPAEDSGEEDEGRTASPPVEATLTTPQPPLEVPDISTQVQAAYSVEPSVLAANTTVRAEGRGTRPTNEPLRPEQTQEQPQSNVALPEAPKHQTKTEEVDVSQVADPGLNLSLNENEPPASDHTEKEQTTEGYRKPGELEVLHNLEPLPPTPITPEARDQLGKWGLEERHIERLQEVTSSFRYDACPEKAKRIAEKGGFIGELSEKGEVIVLPDFHRYDSGGDGECTALSGQLGKALHESGFLDDLNQDLATKGKDPVRLVVATGQARTHFADPGDLHAWTGLLSDSAAETDFITVDASFQEISKTTDNGYTPQAVYIDPRSITFPPAAVTLSLGTYQESETSWTYDIPKSSRAVLGTSPDREIIYSMCFLKDEDTQEIRPGVTVSFPQGGVHSTLIVSRTGDRILTEANLLNDAQRETMGHLLDTLSKITLTRDQLTAQALAEKNTVVQLQQ